MARRSKYDPTILDARKTTYKGRLKHVDDWLIRSNDFTAKGAPIQYLDVGCSPQKTDAPTTLETLEVFREHGIPVDITAVDKSFPHGFTGNDDIYYKTHDIVRKPIRGQFDIVRYVNVEEHLPPGHVPRVRAEIEANVAEGGFLIRTSAKDKSYEIYRRGLGGMELVKTLRNTKGKKTP